MMRLLALAALIVGVITGGAEGEPTQGCVSAVIDSTKSANVLRCLKLPVSSVVADGRGGWLVADRRLRNPRSDGSVDRKWHSPVRRRLPYGSARRMER